MSTPARAWRPAPVAQRAARAVLRDRRLLGAVLLGVAAGGAAFATLAIVRAVPPDRAPAPTTGWGIASAVALAVGGGLWLLADTRLSRRAGFGGAGAGLALTLLATLVLHPGQWRSIAGHPDNSPSRFYATHAVDGLLDRLASYAADRTVLGLYLSNHYESSVIVPLAGGPAGSTGGEIISVLADGSKQTVQTKLSPGVAAADGVNLDAVRPRVVAAVVQQVSRQQRLGDRDEVRVQIQNRGGATRLEVLPRRAGVDQPWRYFDLDGEPIPR
ncbi:hypothetical protein [Cumulibacter manganitolerans]|uniref:hypothetical protein n=1 Tax=Cumulibacter manganitolerans TaxID=1884992 RepID=UPI0012981833|nr:hypothetical protein [Cumulibacter manganitolerans]